MFPNPRTHAPGISTASSIALVSIMLAALPATPAAAVDPLDLTEWALIDPGDDWSYTTPDALTGFMDGTTSSPNVTPGWVISDVGLCPTASVAFTMGVQAGAGDDDLIGFAFSYTDNDNFMLLDWKRSTQTYNFGDPVAVNDDTAEQGMKIKRIVDGWTHDGLWGGGDGLGVTTVAGPVGGGWVHGETYDFEMDLAPGSIVIRRDGKTLFDLKDEDYPGAGGRIAFYGFSQDEIIFADVTIDTDGTIPEDLSGDCLVDVTDLLILLGAWNSPDADFNDDGTTDVLDLLILLSAWS